MRILFLTLLSALALPAQQLAVQADPAKAPAVRLFVATHFADQADADQDGQITEAEATAWLRTKAQEVIAVFERRAQEHAAAAAPNLLDAETRAAKQALDAAQAAYDAKIRGARDQANDNGRR